MKNNHYLLLLILAAMLLGPTSLGYGQASDSSKLHWYEPAPAPIKSRIRGVGFTSGGLYLITMAGLNQLWYADFERSGFQFFNDNREWKQIDKIGHTATAFYTGVLGIKTFQWTGMPRKKAIWIGGTMGFAFLTTVEVFDGFSEAWGFSNGDMAANAVGTSLAIGQELLWEEQRVLIKFSYKPSDFAQYRPGTLGAGFSEEIIKDYNAQTYWLTYPIRDLFGKNSVPVPPWLSLAVGYGADGMLGGFTNPAVNAEGMPLPEFERFRQYYLSLDVDLTRIKTKSKGLQVLLTTFGYLKVPFPALYFSQPNGVQFQVIGG